MIDCFAYTHNDIDIGIIPGFPFGYWPPTLRKRLEMAKCLWFPITWTKNHRNDARLISIMAIQCRLNLNRIAELRTQEFDTHQKQNNVCLNEMMFNTSFPILPRQGLSTVPNVDVIALSVKQIKEDIYQFYINLKYKLYNKCSTYHIDVSAHSEVFYKANSQSLSNDPDRSKQMSYLPK